MAYTKTVWTDRVVQYPNRYKDQNLVQYTFTRDEGTITAAGTGVSAVALNNIENGIKNIETAGASYPFTNMPYVGTAPIVESGTGYVKFADGTMIATGSASSSRSCSTAPTYGGGFVSADLAMTFAGSGFKAATTPKVMVTNTQSLINTGADANTITNTGFNLVWHNIATDTARVRTADYIAIGVWK